MSKKLLQRKKELLNILMREIDKFFDNSRNKDLDEQERALVLIDVSANLYMKIINDSAQDLETKVEVLTDIYKTSLLHMKANQDKNNELH